MRRAPARSREAAGWAGGLDAGRLRGDGKLLLGVGDLEVALGEFLDVDVLERHDLDVLDETGGAVHVPHPGVLHDDLEEHLAVVGRADVQLDLVGEVEPALHLGLVFLEIFRAHALPSDQAATGATAQVRSTIGQFSWLASLQAAGWPGSSHGACGAGSPQATPLTLTKEWRCSGQGPCALSAFI